MSTGQLWRWRWRRVVEAKVCHGFGSSDHPKGAITGVVPRSAGAGILYGQCHPGKVFTQANFIADPASESVGLLLAVKFTELGGIVRLRNIDGLAATEAHGALVVYETADVSATAWVVSVDLFGGDYRHAGIVVFRELDARVGIPESLEQVMAVSGQATILVAAPVSSTKAAVAVVYGPSTRFSGESWHMLLPFDS